MTHSIHRTFININMDDVQTLLALTECAYATDDKQQQILFEKLCHLRNIMKMSNVDRVQFAYDQQPSMH